MEKLLVNRIDLLLDFRLIGIDLQGFDYYYNNFDLT